MAVHSAHLTSTNALLPLWTWITIHIHPARTEALTHRLYRHAPVNSWPSALRSLPVPWRFHHLRFCLVRSFISPQPFRFWRIDHCTGLSNPLFIPSHYLSILHHTNIIIHGWPLITHTSCASCSMHILPPRSILGYCDCMTVIHGQHQCTTVPCTYLTSTHNLHPSGKPEYAWWGLTLPMST